jgi:hypothetical protein
LSRHELGNQNPADHRVADLFNSDDFPAAIPDPEEAAKIVVQRLIDAGVEIRPAR